MRYTPHNVLNEAMVNLLRLLTRENTQIILIAFVYTLGMFVTTCLFLFHYAQDHKHRIVSFFGQSLAVTCLHLVVLVLFSKLFLNIFSDFAQSKTLIGIVVQAGLSFTLASIIWFMYLFMVKNEHIEFISNMFQNFFSSHKVILEETQDL